MRRNASRVLAVLALAALLPGCGGSPFAVKPPVTAVEGRAEYSVKLSGTQGSPGSPIQIRLRLASTGTGEILIPGCGGGPARDLLVIGPYGQVVRHETPLQAYFDCASFTPFGPGTTAEWSREFTGQLFTESGDTYAAPTGTYTVLARLRYLAAGDFAEFQTIERAASFYWSAP